MIALGAQTEFTFAFRSVSSGRMLFDFTNVIGFIDSRVVFNTDCIDFTDITRFTDFTDLTDFIGFTDFTDFREILKRFYRHYKDFTEGSRDFTLQKFQ